MDWYNRRRGHWARDNLRPVRDSDPPILTAFPVGEIVCDSELGGQLKSYRRVAKGNAVGPGKRLENRYRNLWRRFWTARNSEIAVHAAIHADVKKVEVCLLQIGGKADTANFGW